MNLALPIDALRFIRTHVTSIEQLELLTLLRDRRAPVPVPEITRVLASNETSILARAGSLVQAGLLRREVAAGATTLAFAPSEALAQVLQQVLQLYHERRQAVIEVIYRPDDDLRQFSDAFRITPKGPR